MRSIIFVGAYICFALAAQLVTKSGSGFATSDSSELSLFRTDLAGNLTYASYTSVAKYYGPPIIDANRTNVYTVTRTTNYLYGVVKWNYIGATPQFESYCQFPSTIQNVGLVLDDSVPPKFYGLQYVSVQSGAYAVWRITNINNCTVENTSFRTIYLKQSVRISSLISFRGGAAIVIEPSTTNNTIFCVNHYNFVTNTLLESTCSLNLNTTGIGSSSFSWEVDYVTGDIYLRKNLFNRITTDIWVLRRSPSNDGYTEPWRFLGRAPSNLGLQIGDADDCSAIIIDYDDRWYFRSSVANETTLALDVLAQSPLLQWSLSTTGGGWVADQYYSNGTYRARCSARPGRVFTTSTSSAASSTTSSSTSAVSSSSSGNSSEVSTGTTTNEESETSGAFALSYLFILTVVSCL